MPDSQPPTAMNFRTTLLLSAALAAVAPLARAGDRNPFGNGELPEILKPYDVDGDGKLSEEERQAYLKAVREGQAQHPERPDRPAANPWDTNGDGVLSDAEKAAAQEAIRAKIEQQRTSRFDELDKNDDGFLSLEELGGIPGIRAGSAERILAHLDTDKDGKVSKAEFLAALRPPRPSGGDGGGGRGDGGGDPPPPPPPPPGS